MKLISDEEIGNAIDLDSNYEFPCSDGSINSTFDCRPIAQAQLESCEKEGQEEVREIFRQMEGIVHKKIAQGERLQALKEFYLGGE